MKLTTWNVNGLRALLRKDGWDWVDKTRPDALCLQEIKAKPESPRGPYVNIRCN